MLTKPKIERLEFSADSFGNGLDFAERMHGTTYTKPDARFVVGLFNDHMEAYRYLCRDDLITIRDWIDEVLKTTEAQP